ncbi:unnamed protein product [Angiostrongylus costaricensis]|uniref:Uncharacterized protein n=1 Tax=Angiostrongylus costaricensis TaxID=334426 RepID=A0A0R3PXN6_ANGCS|nr:unnamed protein product [Angiostrongylus costaricensis]
MPPKQEAASLLDDFHFRRLENRTVKLKDWAFTIFGDDDRHCCLGPVTDGLPADCAIAAAGDGSGGELKVKSKSEVK